MRNLYICFSFLLLFSACDDGDIISVNLAFDKELKLCNTNSEFYVIYDTKEDPSESLTLLLRRTPENEVLFTTETSETRTIDGNNIRFNYRTYNRTIVDDELCDVIQPSDLVIGADYEASTGTIQITTTFEDDDNDGIPSVDEDRNNNGDYNDDDTDTDGIPDYLDEDDDGDNVKTSDEDDNLDGDNNPFTNPRNTDGLDDVDYLDNDDDGDGVLTRLEDANGNKDPLDDFNPTTDGSPVVPYFLDNTINTTNADPGSITNTYTRTISTQFFIENIDLDILRTTTLDFGIFTSTLTIQ